MILYLILVIIVTIIIIIIIVCYFVVVILVVVILAISGDGVIVNVQKLTYSLFNYKLAYKLCKL